MTPYQTVAESHRQNGERHAAKARYWLEQGKPDYAAGSQRKADRNFAKAKKLDAPMEWPSIEHLVAIGASAEMAELVKQRVNVAYEVTKQNMTQQLYGEHSEILRKRPSWNRRLYDIKWRILDAWEVLRGRADIS